MRRTVETLAAVKVSERETVRRRRYYVDADAIAASKRPIKSVERIGGQAAVFIVLKTGVDFEVGVGSFVLPPRADTTRQR
jgi:hypothetical protein